LEKKGKPLLERIARNLGARIALVTVLLGGGGYAAYQEVPAIHQTVDNLLGKDTVAPPFDISKLDTQRQEIVFGQNAREATDQDVKNFMSSPLPKIKSTPKSLSELSSISVIFSLDLQNTEKMEIWRTLTGIKIGESKVPAPIFTHISMPALSDSGGIIKVGGVNVDTVEIFRVSGTNEIIQQLDLGNNRYIMLGITDSDGPTGDAMHAPLLYPENPKNGVSYISRVLKKEA